jgi:tetratricopeptide (TPR) repeat protein
LSADAQTYLIDHASQAVALEPGNVSYQLNLADNRWESIAARSQSADGTHLALTSESVDAVRQIVRQLRQARIDCPTFGPLYSFTGQMEKYVLKDPSGDADIRTGAELTSYDANVCFLDGQLEASQKNWDLALARLHRSVDLNDGFRNRVLDTLVAEDQRPDLALPFAAGHRDAMLHLSSLLASDTRYSALADQLRAQELDLLIAQCQDPSAPASDLIQLADEYQNQKNDSSAIDLYRRALSQDYGQIQWRLKLADALARTNQPQEAMRQARICLQLSPTLKAAQDMIVELSDRPGTAIDR